MIESILAATDGSDVAQAALEWAALLSHRRHARLDVVHVIAMPQAELPPEVLEEMRAEAASRLNGWIDTAGAAGNVDDRIIDLGAPADRIAGLAQDMQPDLLVLGTGPSSDSFTRLALGSTAHQVVHHYHGPLAAIPGPSELDDSTQIVVGVDGSDGASRALHWAAQLSTRLKTNPLAVYVPDTEGFLVSTNPEATAARARADVERQVANESDDIKLRLAKGDPVEELAAVAAEFPSSILVVGTRSHRITQHQILGRVPMELLHHCQRPVVVIPAT